MEFMINVYKTKIRVDEIKRKVSEDIIKEIEATKKENDYFELLVKHSKIINEQIGKLDRHTEKLNKYLKLKEDLENL